jgi:hypothetical protein
MEQIDATIQKGNVLLAVANKHAAGTSSEGISADAIQGLSGAIDDALAKDTAQKSAVQNVTTLTALQNETLDNGMALIRKEQNAGKTVYGEDNKPVMKELHVGWPAITTVKALTTELAYCKSIAQKRATDLAKAGFKDSDIAAFDTITDALGKNDTEQENAKKLQKKATKVRDDAMIVLKKAIKKVQNNARVVFAGQPNVLIEFEPVAPGHGGTKAKPAAAKATLEPPKTK